MGEEKCVISRQSERESDDAAWMSGGDEWDLLHNLTSFPRFETEYGL